MAQISPATSKPKGLPVGDALASLVNAVINKEPGAFNKLHATFKDYVISTVYNRYCQGRPDAYGRSRDISQEIWQKVALKVHKIRNPAHFKTWIYPIIRNTSLTYLSKLKEAGSLPIGLDGIINDNGKAFQIASPLEDSYFAIKGIGVARLLDTLNKLTPDHKEVIVMHYLEGKSGPEIAEELNISHETVRSRLHYARESMKSYLVNSNN